MDFSCEKILREGWPPIFLHGYSLEIAKVSNISIFFKKFYPLKVMGVIFLMAL